MSPSGRRPSTAAARSARRVAFQKQGDGGRVRFGHGAPRSDELTITRLTPDERLRGLLTGVAERVVVCGHTHVQFDGAVEGVRVVNAGRVGTPYEAEPAAFWALLDDEVDLRRTEYDVWATVAAILATGLPENAELRDVPRADPERRERLSALIEDLSYPPGSQPSR